MGTKIRIQEFIKLSGRTTLSQIGYDNIRIAYMNMRYKARVSTRKWGEYVNDNGLDKYINHATLEQIGDTLVVTNGKSIRVFSLVIVGQKGNIPFNHLAEASIPIKV